METLDHRTIGWERLCLNELAGRVEKILPKGDLVIRSDQPLVHPAMDEWFVELYGGVPEPDQRFEPGDRVAFRLKPSWTGNPRTGMRPDPVMTNTIRLMKDGEELDGTDELKQVLADVTLAPELAKQNQDLKEELARRRDGADRIIAEAREEAARIRSDADAYARTERGEIQSQQEQLRQHQEELDRERNEFEARGGRRFILALAAGDERPTRMSAKVERPNDAVGSLGDTARTSGLAVEDWLVRRVLVAHLIAALTGQILIYGGPPGSGKTTMSTWMPRALDMGVEVLPVRPGWLDAADLLGYYDPRKSFVPAPFLDYVLEAARGDVPGGIMHVAVLDEMNITRIENYGADLLSQMEKVHENGDGGWLTLYSRSIQEDLDRAAVHAAEGSVVRPPKLPARLRLPQNLILAGTLNNDDTTEALSPKVLDRALGVRIPNKGWRSLPRHGEARSDPVFSMGREFVSSVRSLVPNGEAKAENHWSALTQLLDGLRIPSVQVSHRLAGVVNLVPAISDALGAEARTVLDDVICLNVLPKIRFFKDSKPALEDAKRLRDRAGEAELGHVEREINELLEESDELIQYLR